MVNTLHLVLRIFEKKKGEARLVTTSPFTLPMCYAENTLGCLA